MNLDMIVNFPEVKFTEQGTYDIIIYYYGSYGHVTLNVFDESVDNALVLESSHLNIDSIIWPNDYYGSFDGLYLHVDYFNPYLDSVDLPLVGGDVTLTRGSGRYLDNNIYQVIYTVKYRNIERTLTVYEVDNNTMKNLKARSLRYDGDVIYLHRDENFSTLGKLYFELESSLFKAYFIREVDYDYDAEERDVFYGVDSQEKFNPQDYSLPENALLGYELKAKILPGVTQRSYYADNLVNIVLLHTEIYIIEVYNVSQAAFKPSPNVPDVTYTFHINVAPYYIDVNLHDCTINNYVDWNSKGIKTVDLSFEYNGQVLSYSDSSITVLDGSDYNDKNLFPNSKLILTPDSTRYRTTASKDTFPTITITATYQTKRSGWVKVNGKWQWTVDWITDYEETFVLRYDMIIGVEDIDFSKPGVKNIEFIYEGDLKSIQLTFYDVIATNIESIDPMPSIQLYHGDDLYEAIKEKYLGVEWTITYQENIVDGQSSAETRTVYVTEDLIRQCFDIDAFVNRVGTQIVTFTYQEEMDAAPFVQAITVTVMPRNDQGDVYYFNGNTLGGNKIYDHQFKVVDGQVYICNVSYPDYDNIDHWSNISMFLDENIGITTDGYITFNGESTNTRIYRDNYSNKLEFGNQTFAMPYLPIYTLDVENKSITVTINGKSLVVKDVMSYYFYEADALGEFVLGGNDYTVEGISSLEELISAIKSRVHLVASEDGQTAQWMVDDSILSSSSARAVWLSYYNNSWSVFSYQNGGYYKRDANNVGSIDDSSVFGITADGYVTINGYTTALKLVSGRFVENENGYRQSVNYELQYTLDGVAYTTRLDSVLSNVEIDANGYWVVEGITTDVYIQGSVQLIEDELLLVIKDEIYVYEVYQEDENKLTVKVYNYLPEDVDIDNAFDVDGVTLVEVLEYLDFNGLYAYFEFDKTTNMVRVLDKYDLPQSRYDVYTVDMTEYLDLATMMGEDNFYAFSATLSMINDHKGILTTRVQESENSSLSTDSTDVTFTWIDAQTFIINEMDKVIYFVIDRDTKTIQAKIGLADAEEQYTVDWSKVPEVSGEVKQFNVSVLSLNNNNDAFINVQAITTNDNLVAVASAFKYYRINDNTIYVMSDDLKYYLPVNVYFVHEGGGNVVYAMSGALENIVYDVDYEELANIFADYSMFDDMTIVDAKAIIDPNDLSQKAQLVVQCSAPASEAGAEQTTKKFVFTFDYEWYANRYIVMTNIRMYNDANVNEYCYLDIVDSTHAKFVKGKPYFGEFDIDITKMLEMLEAEGGEMPEHFDYIMQGAFCYDGELALIQHIVIYDENGNIIEEENGVEYVSYKWVSSTVMSFDSDSQYLVKSTTQENTYIYTMDDPTVKKYYIKGIGEIRLHDDGTCDRKVGTLDVSNYFYFTDDIIVLTSIFASEVYKVSDDGYTLVKINNMYSSYLMNDPRLEHESASLGAEGMEAFMLYTDKETGRVLCVGSDGSVMLGSRLSEGRYRVNFLIVSLILNNVDGQWIMYMFEMN